MVIKQLIMIALMTSYMVKVKETEETVNSIIEGEHVEIYWELTWRLVLFSPGISVFQRQLRVHTNNYVN